MWHYPPHSHNIFLFLNYKVVKREEKFTRVISLRGEEREAHAINGGRAPCGVKLRHKKNLRGYLYAPVVLLSGIDHLILLIRELAGPWR
jgi:hypothetical protein